ncbi:MAG: cytochrome c family protein [Candidatus Omnitrophota bacterium]|nr:cytochrome c family protein [Candidatus Omnitrophota bacterium]
MRLFTALLSAIIFFASPATAAQMWDPIADNEKITGPESCAECHADTFRVWEGMHHATTFRDMPRSDAAREIADKLGIQRIKTEPLCLSCHFTTMLTDTGKSKPVSGISCESCHGAGKDWINVHSDYGPGADKDTESADHRAKRLADSEAAGMIRPRNLHAWASNCYNCHTVPDEKLVNMGGHPAGSKFELVSWSQGEVRHNVWFSGGVDNVMATPERKRVMYVTGQALDLAYALRGLSKATEGATYAITMAKRAKAAMIRLGQIDEALTIPEVKEILKVADAVKLDLNNEAQLSGAADDVANQALKFTEAHDGSALAALDSLIPSPDAFRGTPAA